MNPWISIAGAVAALALSLLSIALTASTRRSHRVTVSILTTQILSVEERLTLGAVLWAAQRVARHGLQGQQRLQEKLYALPDRVYELASVERFKPEGGED